jgi:F-type H+-transporting ATPase subunit a
MEQLWFTALLNRLFGGPLYSLLTALHIHVNPKHATTPISNSFAMEVIVMLLLITFFIAVRLRLSVDQPGGLQHSMESIETFIGNMGQEIIGSHYKPYHSYLVTLGLFILTSNLIGLIPGFESPTAVAIVPLGCALVTWFYYHFQGLRTNGVGYFKNFMGPVWWLAPLMLPIEIFSHTARLLSLTVRLYANMFAGEMVTLVFFSLIPIGVPIVFEGLHVGVSLIQTYIFVILACVYLGEATAHGH